MDIRLQGALDGIQTMEAIRNELDVPVIYLTAHSDDATLVRAKGTGPLGYLISRFTGPELRCAIEIALHKHAIDAKLHESEERLRQAEKIEAVTRLSGGRARIQQSDDHDSGMGRIAGAGSRSKSGEPGPCRKSRKRQNELRI